MIPGIDVSHWQRETPGLSGVEFVVARATYGTAVDDRYQQHKANVLRAGKVFGAYAFGREMDGTSQARAFLNVIGTDTRLVALDYERDPSGGHMTPDQARAFIRAVQATGRTCGLYASAAGYPRDLGQDWCWIAKWSDTQPQRPWAFWQYDGSGADRIDNDWFDGTLDELRAMAGMEVEMQPLAITGTTPVQVTLTKGDQLFNPDGSPLTVMSVDNTKTSHYEAQIGAVRYRVITIIQGGEKLALVRLADVTVTPVEVIDQADLDAATAAGVATGVQQEKARIREVLGL